MSVSPHSSCLVYLQLKMFCVIAKTQYENCTIYTCRRLTTAGAITHGPSFIHWLAKAYAHGQPRSALAPLPRLICSILHLKLLHSLCFIPSWSLFVKPVYHYCIQVESRSTRGVERDRLEIEKFRLRKRCCKYNWYSRWENKQFPCFGRKRGRA